MLYYLTQWCVLLLPLYVFSITALCSDMKGNPVSRPSLIIRPQQGRQRQFHQVGIETLGDPHPYCDVTHLAIATELLKQWNLLDSATVSTLSELTQKQVRN